MLRLIKKKLPKLFDIDNMPASRFAGSWEQPPSLRDGLTLACRIHAPAFAVTIPMTKIDKSIIWLPTAPKGQSVEVAIFLCNGKIVPNGWPGRVSMGTHLIGTIDLDHGGCVCLVWSYCETLPWVLPPAVNPRFLMGRSAADLIKPGSRAIVWGQFPDGSLILQEGPIVLLSHNKSNAP